MMNLKQIGYLDVYSRILQPIYGKMFSNNDFYGDK